MKHPAKKQRYDYTLLVVVLLLVGIGLILLYSTSAYNGRVKFHDSFYYLKKQGFATALGLAGMFIVAGIDYHRWIPFAKLGYVTAIVLSVAVMFIGDEYNGSKRWLSLGPISFQPSEFAKVAVILYLSCVISNQARKMEKFTTLVKVMLPVLPVVGLVGASNLSTAIISIICEELGLVGASLIILLFLILIWRFFVIATHAKDLTGALIATGAMAHMMIQVILNIAVVTNSIPNTGITLPFISYGGTSVVFLLLEMGLVLSASNLVE